MHGRALEVEAKGVAMLIDVMTSPCRRRSRAPSRLAAVLALSSASLLAPRGALAEQAPASPRTEPAPAAPPDAPQFAAPAQPARATVQQADAAFQEGRALLESGHYREACARFELSQRLDPSPGTLLNLGSCRELEGDLVQALATFEQALDGAREARDRRRRQLWGDAARERIASLTPRVPRVSVRRVPEGARVSIDQRPVAAMGGAMRINPGAHSLTVNAPGMRTFVQKIEIATGQQLAIDVPPLEPESEARAERGAEEPAGPPVSEAPQSQERPPRYGAWPYVLGGAGAVLLGTSVVTGLGASAARDELERECTGNVCNPSLRHTRDRADRLATLTDVFWITGAVVAGVGVTLFVLDLGHERGAPALEAGCFDAACGLRARASF
jgi:PEGA domain-containing protein